MRLPGCISGLVQALIDVLPHFIDFQLDAKLWVGGCPMPNHPPVVLLARTGSLLSFKLNLEE